MVSSDAQLLSLPNDLLRKIYQMLILDAVSVLEVVGSVRRRLSGVSREIDAMCLDAVVMSIARGLYLSSLPCRRLREIYLQVTLMNPRLYISIPPLTRYCNFNHYIFIVHRYSIDCRRRRPNLIKLTPI